MNLGPAVQDGSCFAINMLRPYHMGRNAARNTYTYLLKQLTSHPRRQLQWKNIAVSNCVFVTKSGKIGRVVAVEGRHRLPTAGARVRVLDSICGVCGGQSGAGKGFCYSNSGFPCQYDFTNGSY